jgi:hypothetical protein
VQWTWAATILQSSNVAWEYGVSGPFWYASGATIQVCQFLLNFFSSVRAKFACFLQKNPAGAQVLEFKLDVQASLIDEEEIGPFILVGVLLGPHL